MINIDKLIENLTATENSLTKALDEIVYESQLGDSKEELAETEAMASRNSLVTEINEMLSSADDSIDEAKRLADQFKEEIS